MKRIKPTPNAHSWPRQAVNTVECRKRDLVIRIADWTRSKEEPAYGVEVYIGGIYDWNESKAFTVHPEWVGQDVTFCATKAAALEAASEFAQAQIRKLL
jgi:hypothetical protein